MLSNRSHRSVCPKLLGSSARPKLLGSSARPKLQNKRASKGANKRALSYECPKLRGKGAQFFSLYLVLLTLLMCGVVIGTYLYQQGGVGNSLVSPKAVLDVRDELDIFELREMELINSSLNSAVGTFPEQDFIDSFRSIFIAGFMADGSMKNFILKDLTLVGENFEEEARENFQNFLEGGLYTRSLTKERNGKLIFTRAKVRKASVLWAKDKDKSKINFPVDFSFEFGKEYTISFEGGVFEIR